MNIEESTKCKKSARQISLAPSDFGPYLADELEQFDRYLAEYQSGVSFEQWVKAQIDEALHDWEMSE